VHAGWCGSQDDHHVAGVGRGRSTEPIRAFLERTEEARTSWKVDAVRKINESRDWKAQWKLLVARFPTEFRNYLSVNSEISGPNGDPISIEHSGDMGFNVVIELASPEDEKPDAPRFKIRTDGGSNGNEG
jgi:hypothetical protein